MFSQENKTGKPLADAKWLEFHHQAKIPERTAFAKRIASYKPKRLVDLGCASGLWLELLNDHIPNECEFIGIEIDEQLLDIAIQRSVAWKRNVSFLKMDFELEAARIPSCDITLAFNIFPYIKDLKNFTNTLLERVPRGKLIVRQYDGASIRFGPMPTANRQEIEAELRLSTESSTEFHHYDMDRTFKTLRSLLNCQYSFEFEIFERVSPFPAEFLPYYNGTLHWTRQFLSKKTIDFFNTWIKSDSKALNRYFFEVDLVSILS